MNIQMQICGMIILIVLAVFYKSNKTLRLYSESIFFKVMLFALASLSLDILSLVVIEYRNTLPLLLVNLVCKTYIISLIWVGMLGTIYVLTDILPEAKHRKVILGMVIFTCIQSLIVYSLPIHIFENVEEVYTYGPAVLCVYVFELLYVFATLVILFVYRNRVSRRREFAVGLWMLIWIIAAVIQFFNNELLLVGFASAIGVLILLVIILRRKRVWLLAPAFCVFVISFSKNVSAPGNNVRQAQLEGAGLGMDALPAIGHSFLAAAEYLFRFGGWITLAVLILMIPIFKNMVSRTNFAFAWPGLVSLSSFCLFATGFTPSFYSLGHEGLSRTLNAVKVTYQILLLLNEMYWIGWLVRKRETAGKEAKAPVYWWFFPMMGAVMMVIMLTSSNIAGTYSFYGAYYYVHTGEPFNFYQEYLARVQAIKEGGSSVTVEPYHFRPWILCVDDLSEDGSAEPNRAMAEWYDKEDIFCKVQQ